MKVIFLQDVPRVGKKYDVKKVADGYALNFLIPRKLATTATESAVKKMEVLKKQTEEERKVQEDLLKKNLQNLGKVTLEVVRKANDKGHLFAAIHPSELVLELKKQAHIDIREEHIHEEDPIKTIGEHKVSVRIADEKGVFTVNVKAVE